MIKVSFVVIALNAASTLDDLFLCLFKQTYPHNLIEVILVDSNSTDTTKDKMISFRNANHSFQDVIILDNPQKTLPCGWNVALRVLTGNAVLRVDAHTTFPEDFIYNNVKNLEIGEDICGGKVVSVPADNNKWSVTLNEAENSMFGGSIAKFRHSDSKQYVNTIAFAIYRKKVFDNVGFFNESLTRTEDNEMHFRMKKAGYKFYYDPSIISFRKTRATWRRLLKQKFLNGYWIGRTLGIEPRCFSFYHFVPLAFVVAILITSFLTFFGFYWAAALLWLCYGLANIFISVTTAVVCKERNFFFVLLPFLFLSLHVIYGFGTIVGIIGMIRRFLFKNNKAGKIR